MSDTGTNDEAMAKFAIDKETIGDNYLMGSDAYGDGIEVGWRECRRRYEAQIEERERKAFEAGVFTLAEVVPFIGPSPTWLDQAFRAFKQHDAR